MIILTKLAFGEISLYIALQKLEKLGNGNIT
jgi:hypothetical protein